MARARAACRAPACAGAARTGAPAARPAGARRVEEAAPARRAAAGASGRRRPRASGAAQAAGCRLYARTASVASSASRSAAAGRRANTAWCTSASGSNAGSRPPRGAAAEVRVLAETGAVRLVEAVDPLEQRPRVGHVAGLEVRARAVDVDGLGERAQRVRLGGVRQRAPAHDRVRIVERAAASSVSSQAGRRDAVVVGERHEGRPAPAASRGCAPRPGRRAPPAAGCTGAGRRAGPRRVSTSCVASDEPSSTTITSKRVERQRLGAQAREQLRQAQRAVVRGHDDRDRRRPGRDALIEHRFHHRTESLFRAPSAEDPRSSRCAPTSLVRAGAGEAVVDAVERGRCARPRSTRSRGR